MADMSYCRFENTAAYLADCLVAIDDNLDELSESEKKGRNRLLKLCRLILEEAGELDADHA